MRLHHLRVSAFGPFPGTEEVDFDELNAAGLFLLTGPTGGGKTSILDAICFALYGQVPGARGVKALKSHHAADDARPEVVLDFSVRERRFVVRRSPEWSRPKKRGSGTTEQKASVTLLEVADDDERLLGARAAEVGLLLTDLLGMHAAQFQQVAMLPQGEFQAFLRASSQDRHDVLQRLFKTDRFSRIEEWVNDHSRSLREAAGVGQAEVQRIVDTLADRAGVEPPESTGDVLWAETLLETAGAERDAADIAHDTAVATVAAARQHHAACERRAAREARRAQAAASLETLEEDRAAEEEARLVLADLERAARCAPVLRLLDEAALTAERAARERASDATSAELDEVAVDLRDHIALVQALLPRERAREDALTALAEGRRRHGAAAEELARARAREQELPGLRETVADRLAVARDAAGRGEAARLALDTAERRLDAALKVPTLTAELAALRDAERDARDRAADARQRMQDVVARRLAGIAAELAGRLEDGEPCQVCGSPDHPRPAAATSAAVTEADQDRATRGYDAAQAAHATATRRTLTTDEALATWTTTADGLDADAALAEVETLRVRLRTADEAATLVPGLERQLASLEHELDAARDRAASLRTVVATAEQAVATAGTTIAAIEAELASALGEQASSPLTSTLAELRGELTAVTAARAASVAHDEAVARVAELAEQAAAAATAEGFGSVAGARAAVLPQARREELTRFVHERADRRTRALLVLDEPAPDDEELAAEGGDPAVAARLLADAEAEAGSTARTLHAAEERARALAAGLQRLREAMVTWTPLRADAERAEAMSKLVRGTGADNQLQMRLSAYVLATRLDQVVDAANERLAHMRDQRYLLRRSGRAARKGSQAGLGLEVLDEWTGEVRDPATLSGGETFVVSLCLALGLADVVTHEAGGTEIETLFIDEGFGMLDADTLDDVMDRLDGLRAGGRTVGLVSHVTEMRNRIPAQVHVDKARAGSSIAVRTLTA